MKTVRTREQLRAELEPRRREGASIGLVPTMGALHDGHLALVAAARERCDVIVMSLFVNPTQFRPGEDLDAYPRDEAGDGRLAEGARVDLLYAPDAADVYPEGFATWVEVGGKLTSVLDGDPTRRGSEHFRGVTTVVAKLFNTVRPDLAVFGQKDAQQALVIERMARDLDFGVEILVAPTVREPDGLAMSSRNGYLDPGSRQRAVALSRALDAARRSAEENGSIPAALAAARAELDAAEIEPEYLEARDAESLEPAQNFESRPVLVAVAAQVGPARLIDNVVISRPGPEAEDG